MHWHFEGRFQFSRIGHLVLPMNVPPPAVVLQGCAILHPVAAVEVQHLPSISFDAPFGRLVDVATNYVFVAVANGYFSGGLFEFVDEFNGGLDAVLHPFGQRYSAFSHGE